MSGTDQPAAHADQPDTCQYCVVALGIDNLPVLEEIFGEALGDEVAGAVSLRLSLVVPQAFGLTPLPRRRFLLILPEHDEAAAEAFVHALQETVASDVIATAHGPVAVTVSAGCAVVRGRFANGSGGAHNNPVRFAAVDALRVASMAGVGSFRVARDDSDLAAYRRHLLATSRAALDALSADSLALAYQPVVRASGGQTISFHESLVRIRHPSGSMIAAGLFMPAIEQLGLATMVDRQVLLMCMETLVKHPAARLSINIFPQTMQDRQWLSLFENAAKTDPTLPERMIIEVTESAALLDPPRTRAFMDRVRNYGTGFALDDFGAGATALRYLRDFRFDILKIDGHFVRGIERNPDNAFIAQTIATIADRFDMMTVAEAVQTPAEARTLAEAGIEFFQGFYFGSPSLLLEPTTSPMPAVAAQA